MELPTQVTELLASYPVIVTQAVVWGDMDSYQHVNNVVYFRYFENARLEYFRRMDWFKLEEEIGVGPILAATSARYRKALTYPDTIAIGAKISEIGTDRFLFDYLIVSHKLAAVATEGQGTIVTYDYVNQCKVPVPDVIRRRIAEVEATAHGPKIRALINDSELRFVDSEKDAEDLCQHLKTLPSFTLHVSRYQGDQFDLCADSNGAVVSYLDMKRHIKLASLNSSCQEKDIVKMTIDALPYSELEFERFALIPLEKALNVLRHFLNIGEVIELVHWPYQN